MNQETIIQNQIMEELSKRRCMVLRQQSGVYFTTKGERVRIGFPGLSDLLVVRPDGIVAFLEVKTGPNAHRRSEQVKFIDKCHERGLRAGFVWTVEQALEVVYEEI